METPAHSEPDLPLVSVIMASYNTAAYVAEAIESVLAQDYPNKELIVVDDGSTDGSVDVIRRFGNRVRLLQQENRGPAAARNAGIAAAKGRYIAFHDSDDLWLPGRMTAQVAYLEANPDVALVYVGIVWWFRDTDGSFRLPALPPTPPLDDRGAPDIRVDEQNSGWIYHRLLFDPILSTITTMMRRSLLDQIGMFDESLKRGEDYDLWLRASRVTRMQKLAFPGALYRRHDQGTEKTFHEQNYELQVLERAIACWGNQGPDGSVADPRLLRKRLARSSYGFGYYHFWKGSPRLAFRSFLRSLRRDPARIKTWAYTGLSAARALVPQRANRRPTGASGD